MLANSGAPSGHSNRTIADLMEPPTAVFSPRATVHEVTEALREILKTRLVTYVHVVDDRGGPLIGVVAMRELLLASRGQAIGKVMVPSPFFLRPEMPLLEAMRLIVNRHYPTYPVCNGQGELVGVVRGQEIFEAEAVEISGQPGSMVGVSKEERFDTPLAGSLRSRHPWLQVNLATTFIAAAVVSHYEGMINRYVALAVFLPVMMSQAANTGCQSLAVTLRGITLGDLSRGGARGLIFREGTLGLANGLLTGVTAGLGMLAYGIVRKDPEAVPLALVTLGAMTLCCVVAGQVGAVTPIVLKRLGADPATASSIFLTTITDVISMGFFLWLASRFLA